MIVTKRTRDFITYYYQNKDFPNYIKYDLIELIVASFNDYQINSAKDGELEILFFDFLKKVPTEIDLMTYNPFQYWVDIANDDEFPVGKIISRVINIH